MTAIATLSGRVIDFLNPDPDQILLDDIAIALSRHPRYAGQTTKPYTVAMHSLLVAGLVEPQHRLHALLHDAPEAFMCDVPTPMKEAMRYLASPAASPYDTLEWFMWSAICRRYDLSSEMPEAVHQADRTAMVIEAPILQPEGWKHPVWDFARAEELEIGGVHRERLLWILHLEGGGQYAWTLEVIRELAARRAAA